MKIMKLKTMGSATGLSNVSVHMHCLYGITRTIYGRTTEALIVCAFANNKTKN